MSHRILTTLIAVAACALPLTVVPPAHAEGIGDPRDLTQLILGEVQGLLDNRADMLRCPTLAAGTIGLPELADEPGRKGTDTGNPLKAGDSSRAPKTLPRRVIFRGTTQTFNRRYQFVLDRGTIWYKSNAGITEPWAPLKVDPCFAGKVVGISVDDDELIAIDRDRWIYGMDGALKSPTFFNWSLRWGPPLWTGPGWKLPKGVQDWSWSVLSQVEDKTWTDDAGNAHAVGTGKVSHIWTLSHRGQRLTYLDPWLPADSSYEVCAPHRGRFRSVGMSVSGSTLFVIGRHGDLFTRLFDFDISGADPLFFSYSYANQRGVAKPKIQLPSPAWVRQPKIRGTVTGRISIHKVGAGSTDRQLRVEGRHKGRVGFWHKDIRARHWGFTATGGRLQGRVLDNPRRDTSGVGLGASEDRTYVGTIASPRARVRITNFNTYCTPARLEARLANGTTIRLNLHTTDNIRQSRRARGLNSVPRMLNGAIEVPPALRRSKNPQVIAFLKAVGPNRFNDAPLDATTAKLAFRSQKWTLAFRG